MFGYFPHEGSRSLEKTDFFRFGREFKRIIQENIPTVQEVVFLDPPQKQPAVPANEKTEDRELREALENAVEKGVPVFLDDNLLLPFSVKEAWVVAQLSGLDEFLVRKVGGDWVDTLCALLLREFLLVKRSCIDSLTGLLSSLHLEESLDSRNPSQEGVLFLVAVYPKGSSSFQAKKYQYRTVSLLKSFVDDHFSLYYLGQSCFGIVCENCNQDFVSSFAASLVNYLKGERCFRAHVGSAPMARKNKESSAAQLSSEIVMKKAWAALHVASKRGPFAFCNYTSIEDVENHPFAAPAQRLSRWLQRVTRSLQSFSLVQLDSAADEVFDTVKEFAEEGMELYRDISAVYLMMPEQTGRSAKKEGERLLAVLGEKKFADQSIKVGVSSFPLAGFRKSDLLLNCRKAILHSTFLEPGSVVLFDAVSLNISGDVFYGEGDLVRAVKEYQRGLLLAPDNGNLHNSLGVCYAQMNRHKEAVDCFARACGSKEDQFMALYNLGLQQQLGRENVQAIDSFTQALALPVNEEKEEKARKDMAFRVAVLCAEQTRFEKALDLLLSWYKSEEDSRVSGRAARYLGISYHGLGKYREAMIWLQRAMRHDEFDAEVLGLLGEIYLRENEGDDIALRFCEKSVELNPDSLPLKLRLAKVQIHCGDFQAAVKSLQPCLRNKKVRSDALLQRGVICLEQKNLAAAEKWFRKIDSSVESDQEIHEQARHYLEKI